MSNNEKKTFTIELNKKNKTFKVTKNGLSLKKIGFAIGYLIGNLIETTSNDEITYDNKQKILNKIIFVLFKNLATGLNSTCDKIQIIEE